MKDIVFVEADPEPKKRKVSCLPKKVWGKTPIKTKAPTEIKADEPKKKKKKKKVAEDKSLGDDEEVFDEPSEQVCTEKWRVFGPEGIPDSCDVVGFDIGTCHLAMIGLVEDPDNPDEPKVACAALLNVSDKSTHHACDNIDDILSNNPAFSWVKNSIHHGVEQQGQVNPMARIVAGSIRSCLRTHKFCEGVEPDVSVVSAMTKYTLVQQYTDDKAWHGVPIKSLSGSKNTRKRKLLGELHANGIWKMRRDRVFRRWFKNADKWTEQKHDISDSYLIALRKWKEVRAASKKRRNKKK